ncbi:MAG: tetratricopeptide repeat protein, partial [Rhodospirillaceae bacterium]|nr:tetratricopeptide repeat protein [Rhodospirillaceae bacterium]
MPDAPQSDLALQTAMAAHRAGRFADAVTAYRAALAVAPDQARVHCNMGLALHAVGDLAGAAAAFSRAAELQPGLAPAHAGLAAVLDQRGDAEGARAAYGRALAADPVDVVALNNLGALLLRLGRTDEAVALLDSAVVRRPDSAVLFTTYGHALRKALRQRDAIPAYQRALNLDRGFTEALVNLGHTYRELGLWIEATDAYEQALAAGWPADGFAPPDQSQRTAAFQFGLFDLKIGNLARGWSGYARRPFQDGESGDDAHRRYLEPPPYWQGEPLAGRRIFVWREQGLGDQVMLAGMLPDLIATGAVVTIESKPRLARTFARSFATATVINAYEGVRHIPDAGRFDVQSALGDLGRVFRPDLGRFPRHAGYLRSDAGRVAALRAKYRALSGGRAVVGVAWRSQNPKLGVAKSAELAEWGAVLGLPGAWFVNLQYGEVAADLAAARERLGVEVYQDPEIDSGGDLDDFFAQVAACDLVISTSNTTVHVAGSQNVPCWVVLPRGVGSLWYWFLDRS